MTEKREAELRRIISESREALDVALETIQWAINAARSDREEDRWISWTDRYMQLSATLKRLAEEMQRLD